MSVLRHHALCPSCRVHWAIPSCRLFEATAQKIAANQTAVQRKQTGQLTKHFKLSLLGGLSAAGKKKREQSVSRSAAVLNLMKTVCCPYAC